MRETSAHRRWVRDGRPDRYYDVEAFAVDADSRERIRHRFDRLTTHHEAELWLIARLTPATPFGQGRTRRVQAVEIEDPNTGEITDAIEILEPDGWCYLDNAASQFERTGDWVARQRTLDIDIDLD